MYSQGDAGKNVKQNIIHIEGDADHPVNRGTLCPKGAGLLDFIHSPNRLQYPEVRKPGSKEWTRISWDEALDRIADLVKRTATPTLSRRTPKGRRSTVGSAWAFSQRPPLPAKLAI